MRMFILAALLAPSLACATHDGSVDEAAEAERAWRERLAPYNVEPVGVLECDQYLAAVLPCYAERMGRAGEQGSIAVRELAAQWREQAKDETARGGLAQQCARNMDAARPGMREAGCAEP